MPISREPMSRQHDPSERPLVAEPIATYPDVPEETRWKVSASESSLLRSYSGYGTGSIGTTLRR
jgi:hypothetical protein